MNRRQSREQALSLVFSRMFNEDVTAQEITELSKLCMDTQDDEFSDALFTGVCESVEELDAVIDKYAIGWSRKRISRVSLAILRLAVFEIIHMDEIPISVSIDEAVELAKKFATDEDASFINGILGSVAREYGA